MKAIVNINLRRDILFFYATRFQIELSGLFGLILKRLNQRADSCLNFMINAPFQLCITRVGKLRLADDQKLILPLPLVLRKRQHLRKPTDHRDF